MPIYTVHEPPPKRRETESGPERFVFLRDGFHFWAFLLTPFWMLRHRLWLVLLGYVALAIALIVGLRLLEVSGAATFWVMALLSFLIGLEAGSLRRWTLRRRRWREAGVVSAYNVEEAERRFFDAWTGGDASGRQAATAPSTAFGPPAMRAHPSATSHVVGLFPEPGARQ
ncbi:MAG TPA: DUF2628 domain-containing protein [Xanthobacteraceae bacterium]|nr:DUF2628 domain-containing protein [Xanthobacteraceae bacterium]